MFSYVNICVRYIAWLSKTNYLQEADWWFHPASIAPFLPMSKAQKNIKTSRNSYVPKVKQQFLLKWQQYTMHTSVYISMCHSLTRPRLAALIMQCQCYILHTLRHSNFRHFSHLFIAWKSRLVCITVFRYRLNPGSLSVCLASNTADSQMLFTST